MNIRHKIWLEVEGRVIFGQGREELLKAIEVCHSLSGAAKKLGMSYRAAWGRIRASEERLGVKLVECAPGEKGMHLTLQGKMLLDRYEALEADINHYISRKGDEFARKHFEMRKPLAAEAS